MSKHTPGPWELIRLAPDQERIRLQLVNGGRGVMCLNYDAEEMSRPEGEANARLIAAAPELYRTLSGLLEVHRAHGHVEAKNGWWEEANTAIAKAAQD